jgi:hypothetical protein
MKPVCGFVTIVPLRTTQPCDNMLSKLPLARFAMLGERSKLAAARVQFFVLLGSGHWRRGMMRA